MKLTWDADRRQTFRGEDISQVLSSAEQQLNSVFHYFQ